MLSSLVPLLLLVDKVYVGVDTSHGLPPHDELSLKLLKLRLACTRRTNERTGAPQVMGCKRYVVVPSFRTASVFLAQSFAKRACNRVEFNRSNSLIEYNSGASNNSLVFYEPAGLRRFAMRLTRSSMSRTLRRSSLSASSQYRCEPALLRNTVR